MVAVAIFFAFAVFIIGLCLLSRCRTTDARLMTEQEAARAYAKYSQDVEKWGAIPLTFREWIKKNNIVIML